MNNENKRIDLTQFEGIWPVGSDYLLIAELKRSYEEIDALRSIIQDWVKIETFSDDGKDLFVDMEDSDGNCLSGYLDSTTDYDE